MTSGHFVQKRRAAGFPAACFHLWEDKHREKYSDKLEIRVLELPKLSQYEYPETALLNWAKFINAEKKEEMEKMAQKDDSLKKAYERVLEMSADEKKRLEYEEREKAIRDYNSQIKLLLQRLPIGYTGIK